MRTGKLKTKDTGWQTIGQKHRTGWVTKRRIKRPPLAGTGDWRGREFRDSTWQKICSDTTNIVLDELARCIGGPTGHGRHHSMNDIERFLTRSQIV